MDRDGGVHRGRDRSDGPASGRGGAGRGHRRVGDLTHAARVRELKEEMGGWSRGAWLQPPEGRFSEKGTQGRTTAGGLGGRTRVSDGGACPVRSGTRTDRRPAPERALRPPP